MASIHLDIVTPEKRVVSIEVDEVRAPGAEGQFGVRPGHTPFMTAIEPGELLFTAGGRTQRYAIGGGFIEVAGDKVIVLADTAEPAEEIDIERARRAGEDAMKRLAGLRDTDPAYPVEAARVKRAAARVSVGTRRV
ncbi:MAG: F0F1 ATP synthase subunit epsilon [Myxococcales bacterium]